jgi:homoserine kinase
LIPGFDKIKMVATSAGALGCGISGSGPTVFALSATKDIAQKVGTDIQKEFDQFAVDSEVYVSAINQQGAKVI